MLPTCLYFCPWILSPIDRPLLAPWCYLFKVSLLFGPAKACLLLGPIRQSRGRWEAFSGDRCRPPSWGLLPGVVPYQHLNCLVLWGDFCQNNYILRLREDGGALGRGGVARPQHLPGPLPLGRRSIFVVSIFPRPLQGPQWFERGVGVDGVGEWVGDIGGLGGWGSQSPIT